MPRLPVVFAFLGVLALASAGAQGEDLPYAGGRSSVEIEGLQVELGIPRALGKDEPASLVVILHGAGGTATGMAGSLAAWVPDGYVVCAPKSTGQVWSDADIKAVKRIVAHLRKVLPIDPAKTHVVGFSNGGWNLLPLAFDDGVKPTSATWVASGYRGAAPPKWAKAGLGVLALAGSEDGNASAARDTVKLLRGKVRNVEVRIEPGTGHAWPRTLEPYLHWWMGAQEGRFTPGEDMNFAWGDSIEAAKKKLEHAKRGGIVVYAFQASDQDKPHAKALQNVVLMNELARHYGNQLQAVKLDYTEHQEELAALGVTETPALVILKKDGKPKTVLMGPKKLKLRKVVKALRSVAPNRKKPD